MKEQQASFTQMHVVFCIAMPFPESFGKTCNPDFTALSELNFHSVNPVPTDVTLNSQSWLQRVMWGIVSLHVRQKKKKKKKVRLYFSTRTLKLRQHKRSCNSRICTLCIYISGIHVTFLNGILPQMESNERIK